jgi:hypothetical protein
MSPIVIFDSVWVDLRNSLYTNVCLTKVVTKDLLARDQTETILKELTIATYPASKKPYTTEKIIKGANVCANPHKVPLLRPQAMKL